VTPRKVCNDYSVVINKYRCFVAMKTPATKLEQTIRLVKQQGTIRPRDLVTRRIPTDYLNRLYRRGIIKRVSRGVYAWPDAEPTENHSLVQVARAAPQGVICLLSALQFHGLTTQLPHEVWLALPSKAWVPKLDAPRLRVLRFSGDSLTKMIQTHAVENVAVRIYSPAKTVVDCFKFRNTVGLDVALEALRDYLRLKKGTMDELWTAATICRMTNVMRPYLEAIV
jgi:predicted transcriptional regulator of viral defense system